MYYTGTFVVFWGKTKESEVIRLSICLSVYAAWVMCLMRFSGMSQRPSNSRCRSWWPADCIEATSFDALWARDNSIVAAVSRVIRPLISILLFIAFLDSCAFFSFYGSSRSIAMHCTFWPNTAERKRTKTVVAQKMEYNDTKCKTRTYYIED